MTIKTFRSKLKAKTYYHDSGSVISYENWPLVIVIDHQRYEIKYIAPNDKELEMHIHVEKL